jgi:hypothetical protein
MCLCVCLADDIFKTVVKKIKDRRFLDSTQYGYPVSYNEDFADPADSDPELLAKLEANKEKAKSEVEVGCSVDVLFPLID